MTKVLAHPNQDARRNITGLSAANSTKIEELKELAFSELCLTIGTEMQHAARGCKSTYKLWQQFKADYAPTDVFRIMDLKKTSKTKTRASTKYA